MVKNIPFLRFVVALVSLSFFSIFYVGLDVQALPHGPRPEVVIKADSIELVWRSSTPALIPGSDGTMQVELPGFEHTVQPGIPDLPLSAVLVAIPAGADPVLEILSRQDQPIPLEGSLPVNPLPGGVIRDHRGDVIGGDQVVPDQPTAFHPEPVELQVLGVLRGLTLARLVYYPLVPEGDTLRWTSQVRVRLAFNQPQAGLSQPSLDLDPLQRTLRSMVINPQQVRFGIKPAQIQSAAPEADTISSPEIVGDVAMIGVSQPGITRITYWTLSNASFPVSQVNPHHLHLTHQGSPVAMEWIGDLDSSFEPGEWFLFYASPRTSRWTEIDTYSLKEQTYPGSRIGTVSGSPAGLTLGDATAEVLLEENQIYTPDCFCGTTPLGRDGDRWVWEKLSQPLNTLGTYQFSLPSVNTSQSGVLTVWMISYTDVVQIPDHKVAAYLNGIPLDPGSISWDGKQAQTGVFTVPAGGYQIGNNTFTLSLPGITGVTVEGMWLDAFQVEYVLGTSSIGDRVIFHGEDSQKAYDITLDNRNGLRVYDVTDPLTPLRLIETQSAAGTVSLGDPAGGGSRQYVLANQDGFLEPQQVWLKQDLTTGKTGFQGGDYLIITHDDFLPALQDLVALRQSQGLDVLVETVHAIYDQYDSGRPTPDAIRLFLEDAYYNWQTPPLYVLLVGDGTVDPKHYQPNSFETYLPPYLADVDPWMGESAVDNRFVTLEGPDILPDILIGRLPVSSLAEAQAVLDKIVRYETLSYLDNWFQDVVFVADNEDQGGNFHEDAETLIANHIPDGYPVQRIYHLDGTPPTQTNTAVMTSWNDGPGMLTYLGHGSQHTWAAETILHITNIVNLTNNDRLPVVLEMDCLSAAFQTPGLQVLDEAIILHPDGGGVAVWGPTGLGLSSGHVKLASGFMENVFENKVPGLGLATLAGKLQLMVESPSYQDLVDTYTLFGDPAQILLLAPDHIVYLPFLLR